MMEFKKPLRAELHALVNDVQQFLEMYEKNPSAWDAAGAAALRKVAEAWRAETQILQSRVLVRKEEVMQLVALQSKVSRVWKVTDTHYSHVHNLKDFVASMQTIANCEDTLRSHANRLDFAIKLKSAFELILLVLSKHFGVAGYKTAGSLAEFIQLLKPHFQPPSRINPFYELKDLVNQLAHPKDTNYKIKLSELEDSLHVFLKILEDATAIFPAKTAVRALPLAPKISDPLGLPATTSLGKKKTGKKKKSFDPAKEKTKMCKHWETTGVCPYKECHFAHSEAELRGHTGTRPHPEPRVLCTSVYMSKPCPHKTCRFAHATDTGLGAPQNIRNSVLVALPDCTGALAVAYFACRMCGKKIITGDDVVSTSSQRITTETAAVFAISPKRKVLPRCETPLPLKVFCLGCGCFLGSCNEEEDEYCLEYKWSDGHNLMYIVMHP